VDAFRLFRVQELGIGAQNKYRFIRRPAVRGLRSHVDMGNRARSPSLAEIRVVVRETAQPGVLQLLRAPKLSERFHFSPKESCASGLRC